MVTRVMVMAIAAIALLGAYAQSPRWSVAIDSRVNSQWLSESAGRVYAIRDRHLVALNTRNGDTVWASREIATSQPALAKNSLAVPVHAGIAWVNTQTGRTRDRCGSERSFPCGFKFACGCFGSRRPFDRRVRRTRPRALVSTLGSSGPRRRATRIA